MRHAASELAEGLGPLRPAEALFHFTQIRDIRDHRAEHGAAAFCRSDEVAALEKNGVETALFSCPVFRFKRAPLRKNTLDFAAVGHAVVRMDKEHPDFKLTRYLVRENSKNPLHSARVDCFIHGGVPLSQDLRSRLHGAFHAQFPLPELSEFRLQLLIIQRRRRDGLGDVWI